MDYNRNNTPQHSNRSDDRRVQRVRRQNKTLMAIAVTFVLLLLVFAILLGTGAVMAIKDRNQTPDNGNNSAIEQPGTNNQSPGAPPDDGNEPPVTNQKTVTLTSDQIHEGNLLLVNPTHVYTFPAINLVNVYTSQSIAKTLGQYFQLASANLLMEQTAYQQMDKLLKEFGDSSVVMTSAHRTPEQQTASGSSIPAGYSDSHTGLSCALRGQSGATPLPLTNEKYTWIYENCHKYGFVVRYPSDKVTQTGVSDYTNYFRYVGYVHAYIMKNNNLCLEEYIPYLRSYTFGEKTLKTTTDDGSNYEIYYVAATGTQTQVPVPETGTYTISGDNEGGFIVTVKLS